MRTTTTPARHRTHAAALAGGALVAAAALLSACDHPVAAPQATPAAYVGVCVDPVTHWRVADSFCGGADPYTGAALSHAGYLWDYYPPGYTGAIAAYRQPVTGVPIVHTVPKASSATVIVVDRGASPTGGPIASVRASAAAAHRQATVPARPSAPGTTSAAGPAPSATTARTTTTAPTRATAVTRGGFGVPRRTR